MLPLLDSTVSVQCNGTIGIRNGYLLGGLSRYRVGHSTIYISVAWSLFSNELVSETYTNTNIVKLPSPSNLGLILILTYFLLIHHIFPMVIWLLLHFPHLVCRSSLGGHGSCSMDRRRGNCAWNAIHPSPFIHRRWIRCRICVEKHKLRPVGFYFLYFI